MACSFQKFEFSFYNIQFKRDRFFCPECIIQVHKLRHIKETIGEEVEKVKISANPDNLITKIILAI